MDDTSTALLVALIAAASTLAGGVLGFVGQAKTAARQRSWSLEDERRRKSEALSARRLVAYEAYLQLVEKVVVATARAVPAPEGKDLSALSLEELRVAAPAIHDAMGCLEALQDELHTIRFIATADVGLANHRFVRAYANRIRQALGGDRTAGADEADVAHRALVSALWSDIHGDEKSTIIGDADLA